jgi:hypothetical protein
MATYTSTARLGAGPAPQPGKPSQKATINVPCGDQEQGSEPLTGLHVSSIANLGEKKEKKKKKN